MAKTKKTKRRATTKKAAPKGESKAAGTAREVAAKDEALAMFTASGVAAAAKVFDHYDGALLDLARDQAIDAANYIADGQFHVDDVAVMAAGDMIEVGVHDDPRDLATELSDAWWRGYQRRIGVLLSLATRKNYTPKSSKKLPPHARPGIVGRVVRSLRN